MKARDAEALLATAIPRGAGAWADFGAGDGTFSRALAGLLGAGSRIYAVDRDADGLAALERTGGTRGVELIPVAADFTRPVPLPGVQPEGLDGMIFANSLHFVSKPDVAIASLLTWLRPGGSVVIVEYDGRRPSRWVPYPISSATLPDVLAGAGLAAPTITATRRSAYGGSLYVAVTRRVQRRDGVRGAA
jgi:SAM-dependent methyltransferase